MTRGQIELVSTNGTPYALLTRACSRVVTLAASFLFGWCLLMLASPPLHAQVAPGGHVSGVVKSRNFIRTSLCKALANPARFDEKRVTVHAKYSGTSEGRWLSDEGCGSNGDLIFPFNDNLGDQWGIRDVVRDGAWQDFDSASRRLYSEVSNRGDYDYLTADFSGVLIIRRNFRFTNGLGNGWGHLGMSRFKLLLISVSNVSAHRPLPGPGNGDLH